MIEKKSDVRFEVLMDAGCGAQAAGDILIRVFTKAGKNVFIESIIPSEISPPQRTKQALSGIIVRVSDFELTNIGNETDLILASHEIVLDRRLEDKEESAECRLVLDVGDKNLHAESYKNVCERVSNIGLSLISFRSDKISQQVIDSLGGRGKNIFYVGMICAIFNIPEDIVRKEIVDYFRGKLRQNILEKNGGLFEAGYKLAQKEIPVSWDIPSALGGNEKILIDGGLALGMGIIDAGVKLFTGYPITPAFNVMQVLAKEFPSYGGMVYQAEDEIAAIGTAIGAYFGGLPSATCTSGPGLSLKQEFIGYAAAAEISVIIIDIQRAGPSTGMPTKTEQSDLLSIVYGCHGDNTKIVISVSDSTDCFYAPLLARYLTEKLKLPVFIVGDFQIVNNYNAIAKPVISQMGHADEISDLVLRHFGISRLPDKIEMVRPDQLSQGFEQVCRTTGLNTDAFGSVSCSPESNLRSHAIRNEKLHLVSQALKNPEIIGKEEGELLLLGWGSSKGALEEAVKVCGREGCSVSGMHFKVVYPLPLTLKDVLSRFKHVATVEIAYGDSLKPAPLATLLRVHTGCDIGSAIASPRGCPLRPGIIVSKIKEILGR